MKTPSLNDYLNYNGAHCFRLWASLDNNWVCPGCKRSKFQIMRWTTRFYQKSDGTRETYKGWMAGLHRHHDHSVDYRSSQPRRFLETIICDQCNAADGAVKRKLKLDSNFSFSPFEIAQFVIPTPHSKHKINYEIAENIYRYVSTIMH